MIELLKMCGFGLNEIETGLAEVQEVFERLGINAADISQAKERVAKYYDLELKGVRKMLRLYIKSLVDLVLSKERGKKKIVYAFMAPGVDILGSAVMRKSSEIYVGYPTQSFMAVLGLVFDRLNPILDAAENLWLKAGGVAHCGNVKTLVGLFALNSIPKPDLLVTSGFLCETAPKTIDLLQELYGINTYCCDTWRDVESMESHHARRRLDLCVESMRKLSMLMQEIAGVEIVDDMLWKILSARETLSNAVLEIYTLIESSDPLPLKSTHWVLIHRLGAATYAMDDLPDQTDALSTLYGELQERVKNGFGAVERGAPRIFAVLPPHDSDPRLEQLLDELGIATVAVEGRIIAPMGGYKLNGGKARDPYEIICHFLHTSMYETLKARVQTLIAVCKRLNIEGVLDRYHAGCRSVAGDAMVIRDVIEKELGIPALVLEWENFDPRVYDEADYRVKCEMFKTIVLSRRCIRR